ncbi:MAG: tetratricopeptide repeat protein, partial [Phycisphaerae bacterium]
MSHYPNNRGVHLGRIGLVGAWMLIATGAGNGAAVGSDEDCRSRPAEDEIASSASTAIDIRYAVRPSHDPLRRVDLWITRDCGETWELAPSKITLENPLHYDAPSPGLYGFYLVLHNTHTATPPPTEGTKAHRWVRIVDQRLPEVQILSIRPDKRFDLNREIHIRWRVEDDNCGDRPVAIYYRTEQTRMFKPIADLLPAVGSYRWTLPEGLSGRLAIKVTATDRMDGVGQDSTDRLRIEDDHVSMVGLKVSGQEDRLDEDTPAQRGSNNSQARVPGDLPGIHSEPDAGRDILSARQAKEAKRLYDLGTWHRLRGEYAVAVARYRKALAIYPDFAGARNDLAGALLLQGDVKEAEEEYARLLKRNPRHLPALKGLGLVQARKRKYRSAHETLQKLLLLDPTDAEVWLHFGDVCMFMGDRRAAREAWTK